MIFDFWLTLIIITATVCVDKIANQKLNLSWLKETGYVVLNYNYVTEILWIINIKVEVQKGWNKNKNKESSKQNTKTREQFVWQLNICFKGVIWKIFPEVVPLL